MKAMMRLRLNKKQINRSELLAENGCGCLLGQYLLAVGVDPEHLRPYCLPSSMVRVEQITLPTHASWILAPAENGVVESRDALTIMELSSSRMASQAVAIFARHGVALELFDA